MRPGRSAGEISAVTACDTGGLDRAVGQHLEKAVAELKAARQEWGVWAEGIRRQVEERLGVTGLRDERVMDDPQYAWALDMGTVHIGAVNAAEAALKAVRASGNGVTGPGDLTRCSSPAMGRK